MIVRRRVPSVFFVFQILDHISQQRVSAPSNPSSKLQAGTFCWENCLQHDHRIVLCMEANGIIWNSCTYGWSFLVDLYPVDSFNKTPPPIGREVLSCIFLSLPLCFLDASWNTLSGGSKVHVQCLPGLAFHYTGCLIGILIMVSNDPYLTG